ncbi:MAG: hypothetical protein RR387_00170 [Clostridiales bacterium]
MDQHNEDLLEQIRQEAHCAYISDLRRPSFNPLILDVVTAIDAAAYTLAQWNVVVAYITDQKTDFKSVAQARQCLRECLLEQMRL